MIELFGLLLVPVVVVAVGHIVLGTTITWKEALVQLGACVVLITGVFLIARYAGMRSVEILNGRLTDKENGTEDCCHCRTICDHRDKNGDCTRSHRKCDHSHDYWWSVDLSTGSSVHDGCNSSSSEPKWWTQAKVGEPSAEEHSYTNYLLADPESLFVHHVAKKEHLDEIPEWIPEVTEHYKVSKVLAHGMDAPTWLDHALFELDADLGASKQVDVLVYLTTSQDPSFADAIEQKWVYGPKNALVVVLGMSDPTTIAWARVVTISKVETLKIEIRDQLSGTSLDSTTVATIKSLVSQHFERTPMAEFEYLASAASLSGWGLFFLYVLSVGLSVGLGVFFHREDVFGDESFIGRTVRVLPRIRNVDPIPRPRPAPTRKGSKASP